MSIDTTVPGSPGWWLKTLVTKMTTRNIDLETQKSYLDGNAPLPEGARRLKEAYQSFQRKARTNFGERVIQAPASRMTVAGFRIGDDKTLSKDAQRIWSYNELDTAATDVHFDMLGLRYGYAIVGRPVDGIPVVTREDPLLMIAEPDPLRPSRSRAALKLYRDEITCMDTAYLYLPGVVYTAQRKANLSSGIVSSLIEDFEWVSTQYWPRGYSDVVPVVRFTNLQEAGEFEHQTDTIDRINYMTLQRLVIVAMQAYRQRAVKNGNRIDQYETNADGTPKLDDDGNPVPVDLEALLAPGPGAIWMLPDGVELWESQTTDIQQILMGAKDDIRLLAMATETPISMLWPEGANQSAEGAKGAERGFIFKVEDRQKRASYGWNQVMSLALRFSGLSTSVLDLETLWLPAERMTLAERADAAAKLSTILPRKTLWTDVLQFSPDKADEMETEMLNDILRSTLGADLNAGEASGV